MILVAIKMTEATGKIEIMRVKSSTLQSTARNCAQISLLSQACKMKTIVQDHLAAEGVKVGSLTFQWKIAGKIIALDAGYEPMMLLAHRQEQCEIRRARRKMQERSKRKIN